MNRWRGRPKRWGEAEGVQEPFRRFWRGQASLLRADGAAGEGPSAWARRFCESSAARHLDAGTAAAAQATRERASRGEPLQVLESYLEALCHFVTARECLAEPASAEGHALGAQDVVLRALADLLSSGP